MASIKSVGRSAQLALAPEAPYLAAGTMANVVDNSFSSTANIEIFELNFQSDDRELPLLGGCQSSEKFNRLAWGRNGSGSDQYALGLLAGGLNDGNIDVWNPLSLIRSEASGGALVAHLSNHKGPVRGLAFNSYTPNLLASGAVDGEICIWDLAAPAEPSHFPPLKGSGSATQAEISYVSWNSKVQHILASTSQNGITVVWDLKKQKPVISVEDSLRRRMSVLQWHPEVATQLVIASDEDSNPALQLWDMRNTMTPVKEFVGHTKGVTAMSWCPNDSSYLLTCAKDGRTLCWNTGTGEIVRELPAGSSWTFDVHWYPKVPGVIISSTYDQNINVYNVEAWSRFGAGESDFGTVRAPKWYKRPVGASFGFGGKLVSFHSRSSAGSSTGASEVFLHKLVTEQSLASRSSEFESAIQNGERSLLKALCDKKSHESESEDDRETWGFLKVMFEEDGTARTKLLTHLGFSVTVEEKDALQDNLSEDINAARLDDTAADKVGYELNKESAIFAADDGEDFYNNLPSPKADKPVITAGDNGSGNSLTGSDKGRPETDGLEESADPSFDDAIQRALVVGDYKGAVAKCISTNKMADALVIAHVGGTSLWERTRNEFLKTNQSPYLKIVSAMVNNDLMSLVSTRPLKYWKETLALLCTFAQNEEWTMLCNSLASKLVATGNTLAATLCYICAGNIDKTVEIWSRSLKVESEGKTHVDLFQDLMEKTIVLALASGQKQFSASFCKLVENYAELLASQGLLSTAMEYLKLLDPNELSHELKILRDRIALSIEPDKEAKAAVFDHSEQQSGSVYGAKQSDFGVSDASQHYYQEAALLQAHQSVTGSPYSNNYQQALGSSFGRGYVSPAPQSATYQAAPQTATYQAAPQTATYQAAPQTAGYQVAQQSAPYQPAPQPQMFIPSQAPQVPQPNFAPTPTGTQQAVRTFVPSNVPILRNAEQYQQPTLGSQLYPGPANRAYHHVQPLAGSQGLVAAQPGPIPGHKMPQVVAPTQTPMGFMPVTNSGTLQRPGISSLQPPSPTKSASVQPAVAPATPPPTVQTVDTSSVPVHHRPVITTLTRLFNETSEALGGSRANPARKREIEDNSRKIGALFAKLNSGDISKNASDKLVELCQALDKNDFGRALQIQVILTTSEWDECNFWLAALKRMIKTRQGVGARPS